ncbi:hypothetical protein [Novosphingobium sp. ES2-1]|uniref:hypothetical protein n=1 Tax=Novosphingobium sp. ES2-1 TaxID=2780074 RepID=UPI001E6377B6|nr:hypothetical protein [Novosphingobium sp. ES2-1]
MDLITPLWRLRVPIAIILAATLLWWALDRYVDGAIENDRQESANAALEADAIADDTAGQVASAHASQFAKENDDARKAALDSTDPLRAGLDRLRAGKTGPGEPAGGSADVR